jgi:ABC-type dipeptide/oligopeptide/nickel transport system ATPase subunit
MTRQERINSLYEQIIHLDEIAGQLDTETNARIDAERVALKQRIYVNELLLKHDIMSDDYLCCEDIATLYNIDLDDIHTEIELNWRQITV